MQKLTINVSDSDYRQLQHLLETYPADCRRAGVIPAPNADLRQMAEEALHIGILYLDADLSPEPPAPDCPPLE